MRFSHGVLLATIALALVIASPCTAEAMLIPMTVDQLAGAADTIVVVKVGGARTHNRGNDEARPDIATDYRVQVSRVLKGFRPAEFSLTQPHGTLGDITLVVPDLPTFTPGEQALLFLDGQNRVIGGWQGKLAIERGVISALGMRVDEFARRLQAGESLHGPAVSASMDVLSLSTSSLSAPVITSVSPAGANAGIGETVTITGRNFGTVAGQVCFQRGDSQETSQVVQASVRSWSDMSIVVTVPQKAASFVRVTTADGTASSSYPYQTGFSTDGRHWTRLPVTYRINENGEGTVGEGAAIQRALTTWGSAGSWFRLAYGGSTTKVGYAYNGENTMSFASLGVGRLGTNYSWILGTQLIESDIVFNSDYSWGDTPAYPMVDVESVALHELGHTVGLDDQYLEVPEVMSAGEWSGQRTLSQSEINGAIYLYGYDGSIAPPGPEAWSTSHPSATTWVSQSDVTWGWSVGSSLVPVARYHYLVDEAPDTLPSASGSSTSELTLNTQGLADGIWYLHVQAESSSGLLGPVTHRAVRIDSTAPVGSMVIEDGRAVVSNLIVAIDSMVSDAHSGLDAMRTSTDGGLTWSPWMPYYGRWTVTLPDGDGVKSVDVEYRDSAGNVRTLSDEITLDSTIGSAMLARWYGPDRYATACEIAQNAFQTADTVIIATGEAFPDALSASGLAGACEAPLLLTPGGYLPDGVRDTITSLGATKAIIIGGEGAVSGEVERALKHLLGGPNIERISGVDRYATSAAVADRIMMETGAPFGDTAFVVRGDDFADALAVSPIAYSQKMPVLLTQRDTLPGSIFEHIVRYRVRRCIIVGGIGAVSDLIGTVLGLNTPEPPTRWSGADRYATATEVALRSVERGWAQWRFVGVSTGVSFPDALGGGVASGKADGVLLMTRPERLSDPAAAALGSQAREVRDCRVFGGTGAVSEITYMAVGAALANWR